MDFEKWSGLYNVPAGQTAASFAMGSNHLDLCEYLMDVVDAHAGVLAAEAAKAQAAKIKAAAARRKITDEKVPTQPLTATGAPTTIPYLHRPLPRTSSANSHSIVH